MSNSNPVSIAVFLVGLQPLAKAVGVSYQMIRKTDAAEHAAHLVRRTALAEGIAALADKPVLHGDNGATLKAIQPIPLHTSPPPVPYRPE